MSAIHDRELADTLEAVRMREGRPSGAPRMTVEEVAERWPETFARIGANIIDVADGFDRMAHVAWITRVAEQSR